MVHYPILDRQKKTVATNVTNFDVHDIARACTVYGVKKYYLVHPIIEQQMFVERVLDHWKTGRGTQLNPHRKTALNNVKPVRDLKTALSDWGLPRDQVLLIGTHARKVEGVHVYSVEELRGKIALGLGLFLVFGTGFGLTNEFMQTMDGVLESIRGAPPQDYRHLSVRSAVSIYLDRILGPW